MSTEKLEFISLPSAPEIKLRVFTSFHKKGACTTIVIVPGYLGYIEERLPLAHALSKYYNVILYEPRGYGQSTALHKKGIYGVKDFANELKELIECYQLSDNNFAIFGSSLAVAFIHYYCVFLPDPKPKPIALLLASPSPKYREAGVFRKVRHLPNWLLDIFEVITFTWLQLTRNPEERKDLRYAKKRMKELDSWVQRRIAIETLGVVDFRGRESDIKIPILVLSSMKDDITDPEEAKAYLKGHKLSKQIFINHNSHKFIEGREREIAEYIHTFLEEIQK